MDEDAGRVDNADDGRLIRPFSMRRGRTTMRPAALNMSTLVWTVRSDVSPGELTPEHHRILDLCRRTRSVSNSASSQMGLGIAEIAAVLGIPMTMIKVLVCELIDREFVMFSQPSTTTTDSPDLATMNRVLEGLRGLRV